MSGALKYSQVYTHVGTIFISQSITKLDQNQNRVHRRHVSPKTRMKTARCGGGAAVEFTARREKWRGNQNQQPRTDVWCPPPVFLPKYLPRVRMTCAVGLFIRPCTETSMAPKCGELARMLRDSERQYRMSAMSSKKCSRDAMLPRSCLENLNERGGWNELSVYKTIFKEANGVAVCSKRRPRLRSPLRFCDQHNENHQSKKAHRSTRCHWFCSLRDKKLCL
jgi:hypothetical protein